MRVPESGPDEGWRKTLIEVVCILPDDVHLNTEVAGFHFGNHVHLSENHFLLSLFLMCNVAI